MNKSIILIGRKSIWFVMTLFIIILVIPSLFLGFINNITGLLIYHDWQSMISELEIPHCLPLVTHTFAEKIIRSAVFLSPDNRQVLINKGRIAWLKGDCTAASKYWSRAQTISPEDQSIALWLFWVNGSKIDKVPPSISKDNLASYAYYFGAKAEKKLSDVAALQWYKLSLDLHPTLDLADHMATMYLRKGAQDQYNTLWVQLSLRVPTDNALYWWAIGKIAEIEGNWKSASDYYNAGADISKDKFTIFRYRMQQAEPLKKLGRWQEVIQVYLLAIQAQPKDASTYVEIGNIYYNQQNYNEALTWYTRADQIKPYYPNTVYHIGETYYQQGLCEKAISTFDQVTHLEPKNARAYYYQAQCLYSLGEADLAINTLESAITWSEQQPWQWSEQLGDWYILVGDNQKALDAYHQALKWNPINHELIEKLKLINP